MEQKTKMSMSNKGSKMKAVVTSTRSSQAAMFTCKHCDRPFQTQDGFMLHLTNKHGVGFNKTGKS